MNQRNATPQRSDGTESPAQTLATSVSEARRPYFLPEDIAADRWVHLAALILCTAGIPMLLDIAGRSASRPVFFACLVYSITLVVQFTCSTALYHVPLRVARRRLRQLDHAAIFLLIAGTYTPFAISLLPGLPGMAITALIWSGALGGAIYKLARPLPFPAFSTPGYLLLGGTALLGLGPVLHAVEPSSLVLIVLGLVIYVAGALLRLRRSLRYRNTIWHVMVIVAATCQYAAILRGVVLASGTLR